jgi:hypothetical protein
MGGLRFSRQRVGNPQERVGIPRHILVYQVGADGVVDILGFIPDRMPAPMALRKFVPEV